MKKLLPVLIILLALGACKQEKDKDQPTTDSGMTQDPYVNTLLKQIENNPTDSELFVQLGRAYYEGDNYEDAIKSVKRAIVLDSSQVRYFHFLADIYLDNDDSFETVSTMQRARYRFPDSIGTLLKLSETQMLVKEYDKSLKIANEVLVKSPNNDEAFYMIGMSLKYKGDTMNALKSFQTAVDFNSDHLYAYQELAILCDKLGRDALANKYFDNALRINPNDIFTYFNRGNFHLNRDELDKAVEWYNKAIAIDRKTPDKTFEMERVYFNVGLIAYEYKKLESAHDHFNIAVNIEPLYDLAYFWRGKMSQEMGNKQAAIEDYRQTLKVNPDMKRAIQALRDLGQDIN